MKMERTLMATGACLMVLLSSSCRMLEPQREEVLRGYTQQGMAGEADRPANWWKTFASPQLDGLMEAAFAGNLSLEQAAARMEQAAATARKSGATQWPDLNAGVDGTRQRSTTDAGSTTTESYTAGLYASYEVDLWGRVGSTRRASRADWEASKYDLQTAAMTVSANLASTYFNWLAQMKILSVYENQLKSNRNKLEALQLRYRTGQATSLAVLQQRQQVAAAEAKLPLVQAVIENLENRIALLTGRVPGTDLGLEVESLPEVPATPASGLPVSLLANRPDIQSARLALEAADARVGAARAARLPTLSLTGSGVTSSDEVSDLFDDWTENLTAGLIGPLIDGGYLRAEADRTEAVAREKVAAYREAVLSAIEEAEDALGNERHQVAYVEALARQYAAAQANEGESILRYQRGILSYLDTLTATTSRETLEIAQLQAKYDLLDDHIQLCRALGGDWTFILEEE